jgi:hypothetical protein
MSKVYRIARDTGRAIGHDLLHANHGGLYFTHPSFTQDVVFEAPLSTCKAVAAAIGGCFLVDQHNARLQ